MGYHHGEVKYLNGNRYVGELRDGQRNGMGTYYCANGDEFTGKWQDGNRVKGSEIFFMGDHYVGQYENDLFHGIGSFYIVSRSILEHWNEDHPESLTRGLPPTSPPANPSVKMMPFITHFYHGEWANGKPHGKGAFYWGYGEEGELDMDGEERWKGHLEGEWIEGVYLNDYSAAETQSWILAKGEATLTHLYDSNINPETVLLINSMFKEKTLLMRGNLCDE